MKTQLLSQSARVRLLAFFVLLMACTFGASPSFAVVSNVLFSQDFSGSATVPTGWTDNSYGGWYHSTNGYNGTNGSELLNFWNCNTGELLTPTINAVGYSGTSDSLLLDFDFWLEKDYWDVNYGPDVFVVYAHNSSGATTLITLKSPNDATYDNSASYSWYNDPLTTASAWRHYHIALPSSYSVANLQIGFAGTSVSSCGGNAGIDNVKITGGHYSFVAYAPTSINFGTLSAGTPSAPRSVIVTNPNAIPITVTNAFFSGPSAFDYSLTRSPLTIPAGKSDSFLVVWTPGSAGTRNAVLNIITTADNPPIQISLTGLGTAPFISVPTTKMFSKTRTKLGGSLSQSILITATGAGNVIVSPASFISGSYPSDYTITRLPGPIPAGSSDTLTVTFRPTVEGSRPAILNIVSNAANGTQQVQLAGIGILGHLVLTPSTLNFDSVAIGATLCQNITLWNPGTDTVAVTHNYFSSADADFTLTPIMGTDTLIPPDARRTVSVCFTPVRNGTRTARFRVTTNIAPTFEVPSRDTSSFVVNIIGEGAPFGTLAVGGSPIVDSTIVGVQICRTDTLYNTGSADVTINAATIMGTSASEYTMSGVTLPVVIPAGGKQIFTICVKPTARGDRPASLAVTGSTNGRALNATLPLDVFGQLACASAAPGSAFTTKTCVGMTDTAWVTVTNCGDAAMSYTASLPQTATTYSIVGATTSQVISANGTVKFPVIFKPTDRSAQNATLTITGSKGGVSQTVNLTGTGAAATIAGSSTADTTRMNASTTFSLKVNNTGDCDWTPGAPTFSDPNFTYVSGGTTNIPAGSSGTIQVMFSPTSIGEHTATLSFPASTGMSIPAAAVQVAGFALAPVGVARVAEANGYVLSQNYPNPFNPTTEIRFFLAKDGNAQMNIIDITGKTVRTVFNEHMSSGQHSTVINASELPSGVYFYQLIAGGNVLTRQMVLDK